MSKKNKSDEFTVKLIKAIQDVLDNDENENFIELKDEDATDFFHALANKMPAYAYQMLTGENVNLLKFNHIANQLCFQYMKKEE